MLVNDNNYSTNNKNKINDNHSTLTVINRGGM